MKKTDGFTLIELIVGILCATLVTGAIITFMLMGVRTSNSVIDANADQRNAKIIITMMENLASEGSIQSVDYVGAEGESNQDWSILDTSNSAILSYSGASQSLRGRNGSVLMEGVLDSSVVLDSKNNGSLLTFDIETESEHYSTSVLCRTLTIGSSNLDNKTIKEEAQKKVDTTTDIDIVATKGSRIAFLDTLLNEYDSTGIIKYGSFAGKTYTYWYCEAETGKTGYLPGWNENTPWCATFISWAINEIKDSHLKSDNPREANVDNLWLSNDLQRTKKTNTTENPAPADLIFFDWNQDTTSDLNPHLEHVGVVLYTDSTWIYTIEGNSGGRVALRRYALDDPSIYGYGVLDWATTSS